MWATIVVLKAFNIYNCHILADRFLRNEDSRTRSFGVRAYPPKPAADSKLTTSDFSGKVPPPEVASQLYDIIEAAESLDENSLPQESYIPPPAGQALFDAHRGD